MAGPERTYLAGFQECREGLADLSRAMQRGVGRRALLKPAQMILEAAKANAHVSTRPDNRTPGSLRASGEVKPGRARRGTLATVAVIFEDIAAVPNEYGTTKMSAQPFLRPAVDANRESGAQAFGTALKDEVEAAVARAAAKSARFAP